MKASRDQVFGRCVRPALRAVLLAFATLLTDCTLIPTYHRPALPIPATFPAGGAYPDPDSASLKGVPSASISWQEFFRSDQVLEQLIALALANNRDLRVSTLNVVAARAEYREQRGELFPTINAQGSFTEQRTPTDIYSYGNTTSSAIPSAASSGTATGAGGGLSTAGETVREWTGSLGISSYEVDLFGQVRSLTREAFETALADQYTRRSAQISLIAEVANAYFTLIAARQSLLVSQDTVGSQRKSYDLDLLALERGTGTALTVAQAETSVRTAEASAAQYRRQVAEDEDSLRLLLGATPSPALQAALDRQTSLDGREPFPQVAAGLPSDLILRRPDIQSAEHTLLSANASIGAARANFFPQLTLTAQGGTASNALTGLFRAGQGSWNFSPSVTLPIFDWGINAAKLDYARTQKKVEIANYEYAIQTGFREVSDALASQSTYRNQLAAERLLVGAWQRDYDLSMLRFRTGVDTYLSVLQAQQSLFSSQLTLISIHSAQLQIQVTLYEDLGGGWQDGSDAAGPSGASTSSLM